MSRLPDPPDLFDKREFPGMVGWFDPSTLAKTARKAINSTMFGEYADRRLIHASLDPALPEELAKRYDLRSQLKPDSNSAVWVDYVADLGDGFDSTYAIAYLLGRKTLKVKGAGVLPRGQLLIMGGDQVYPDASREDYEKRMKRPYKFAFPNSDEPGADHPPLFLIPGNHDWYDGLTLFLASFCRGRETKFGSWRCSQHRSYFALRLPYNWWIWAYDSQLGEDIDMPQATYFVEVARRAMKGNPKVILCAPAPTWLKADLKASTREERDKYYRALNYMAYDILKVNCPNARVCAVLSGDLHHYARYSADPSGTQFITAGGGGAFLHPTHHLQKEIKASWVRTTQTLSLTTHPDADHKPTKKESCYPSRAQSRKLAEGNKQFSALNKTFCWALGGVYAVSALALRIWGNDALARAPDPSLRWAIDIAADTLLNPVIWIVTVGFAVALWKYAEAHTPRQRIRFAVAHATAHITAFIAAVSLLPVLFGWIGTLLDSAMWRWIWHPGSSIYLLLFVGGMVVAGRAAGGFIWGRYLRYMSSRHALHYNDGFSSMRLDGFKHFLRLRLTARELTIYPVGLDKVPTREGWKANKIDTGSQDKPVVEPTKPLRPKLIEEAPIVVRVPEVQPMAQIVT